MTKLSILASALMMCTTAAVAQTISIEPRQMWLGQLPLDTVVNFRFKVRNVGHRPLHIRRTNVSCTCTTVAAPTDSIAPGDSAMVDVTFNGRGYPPGQYDRHVTVVSNDHDNYTKRFYFSCEIVDDKKQQ